jgi:hypothetical protein
MSDVALRADLYTVDDVAPLLGITYTDEERAAWGTPPKPVPGFLTFFDPGWSIARLENAVAGREKSFTDTTLPPQKLFTDTTIAPHWYIKRPFAKLEEAATYRQLKIEAAEGSFKKSLQDQKACLLPGEEMALARVVVIGAVVHWLIAGFRLLGGETEPKLRCLDLDHGDRVTVGPFASFGLCLSSEQDNDGHHSMGLAVCRKWGPSDRLSPSEERTASTAGTRMREKQEAKEARVQHAKETSEYIRTYGQTFASNQCELCGNVVDENRRELVGAPDLEAIDQKLWSEKTPYPVKSMFRAYQHKPGNTSNWSVCATCHATVSKLLQGRNEFRPRYY